MLFECCFGVARGPFWRPESCSLELYNFLPNRDVCSFEWFDVWILMLRWLGCWAGERARYSNSHSDWLLRPMKHASFSFLVSFLDSKTVGLRSLVCSKLLKGRRHGAEPFNLKKMETFKMKHIRIWIKMIKTNEKSKTGEGNDKECREIDSKEWCFLI